MSATKKKTGSRALVLAVLVATMAAALVSGCGKDAQSSKQGDSGFSDDTVKRLDRAIAKHMQENDLPGVVVGVWVPGEGEYVVARGKANLKTGEERDLDDPFRIGSITKTFVATVILQLVEEGKLSKSDTLSEWYPDFPNAEKITIDDLLRMRSGIAYPQRSLDNFSTPEKVIEGSAKEGSTFETPGQRTQYSDINYIILGEIIGKVSSQDVGNQITHRILRPLGMKDTVYPTEYKDLPGDLHGYSTYRASGELEDVTTKYDNTAVGGAAVMISDVSDLKTWAEAVCTGKLLKPETQKARLRTQHLQGAPDFVGYGEGILKIGEWCVHGGVQWGFITDMWYLPEKDATIIINVNQFDYDMKPPSGPPLNETIIGILFPKYAVGKGEKN